MLEEGIITLGKRGVSIVEVLIAILIIVTASIATLTWFSYSLGNVGKQGNRRAALERARERLEQLMEANANQITPPTVGTTYWLTCTGGTPCTWSAPSALQVTQNVSVDDLPAQPLETTVQCTHDPSAGTPSGTCDVLEFGAKVWFTANTGADDDVSRVYLRTLRTP